MKRFLSTVVVLLLASTGLYAESIVVMGVGRSGTWDDDIEIANPTNAPLEIQIGNSGTFQPPACTNQCGIMHLTIPAHGSVRLTTAEIPNVKYATALSTVYVTTANDIMPVVRARVFNTANRQQSVEIPAVRVSTIASVRELAFPAIMRTAEAHTNMAIARPTAGPGPLRVLAEAYAPNGDLLATKEFTNTPVGNYYPNLFIVDILGAMGVDAIDDGVLRIVSTDGEPIWGFTSVVFPAGNVSQVVGSNP
jgi:hypothetical protein